MTKRPKKPTTPYARISEMLAMGRTYMADTRRAMRSDESLNNVLIYFWSAAAALAAAEGALEMVGDDGMVGAAMTQAQSDRLWTRMVRLAEDDMTGLKEAIVAWQRAWR